MVLLTAGFLASAPWVFILGPLTLLLLLSRPRTMAEWLTIGIAAMFLAGSLSIPTILANKTAYAGGLFFSGTFLIAALLGMRSLFNRALASLLAAIVATIGWSAALHLRFADIRTELINQTWAGYRWFFVDLPQTPLSPDSTVVVTSPAMDLAQYLSSALNVQGTFFPATSAFAALVGGWLAWVWYYRISKTPMGLPPKPFRTFRFNDHLVWVLVLLAGLALTPTSATIALVVDNALVVVLGLYAARGLAVLQTAMSGASPFVKAALVILSFPLYLLSVGGCIILGVADTWVDFRRRMAPATGAIP